MAETESQTGAENRVAARTNLFLSASIEAAGSVVAVRMRNVSETGALVEGHGLPGVGAKVRLVRGEIRIDAEIVRAEGSRRGVRFESPVAVEAWSGIKPKPLDCTGLRDQRRVDAVQAAIRDGAELAARPTAEPAPASSPERGEDDAALMGRLAQELAYVQRLLEALGDDLVADPTVVHRHMRSLQGMDIANQILGHIARIIVSQDKAAAIDALGMEDLRTRLTRKAL